MKRQPGSGREFAERGSICQAGVCLASRAADVDQSTIWTGGRKQLPPRSGSLHPAARLHPINTLKYPPRRSPALLCSPTPTAFPL